MSAAKARPRPVAISLPARENLSRSRTAERIVEDLRGLIARGEIDRGARLPTERDLAAAYGVSGSTIREAIRALAVMGLVEVRHGSGSYVTAGSSTLIATSFATLMQMEGVSIAEVIELLALINQRAAALAVERASEQELAELTEAHEAIRNGSTPKEMLDGATAFLTALLSSAHEPLLSALGGFLVVLLEKIESDLFPPDPGFWRTLTDQVADQRQAILTAMAKRDSDAAVQGVRDYHRAAITALAKTTDIGPGAKLSEERFAGLISAFTAVN